MKQSNGKQLAKKMLIALVCGLIAGFGCIIFREHLNSSGQGELWKTINNILFQDITAEGATSAIGIQVAPSLTSISLAVSSLGIAFSKASTFF